MLSTMVKFSIHFEEEHETLATTAFSTTFFPGISLADSTTHKTYEEMAFLKHFTGKTPEFIRTELGEPDSIAKKENASGTIEFWIYRDLVQQAHSDKIYRYTQFGIVNGHVETLGHTNRDPK
ncbi:hypothetical protein ACFQE2_09085 [Methylophaga thalassica]|uniref:hypothetical protein n=1 Tax=Methylophaga thalassica TaxID=40223 RepID=UPI003606BB7C